jgi:D-alanyl-D-alanine endopeptidase (penicillin-binding protein 7)
VKSVSLKAALLVGVFCASHAYGVIAADSLPLQLQSHAALVIDEETGEVLYGKNASTVVPIASITKLMTAMVTLDAVLPLGEEITITEEEVDATRGNRSRLKPGMTLSRDELLRLALMASENRAAAALARTFPGGTGEFVRAMNAKAAALDMHDSRFVEPTGLSSQNVASPTDLVKMVRAAHGYELVREYTTTASHDIEVGGRRQSFINTNGLVRGGAWSIGLSKTGFINEAGRCLVMQAMLAARPVIIVLLDSIGKFTRIADAARIRAWLEPGYNMPALQERRVQAKAKTKVRPVVVARTGQRVRVQYKAPTIR